MASDAAQQIIDLLSPSIGDFLATAKVTAACKLSKLDVNSLSPADLPKVADSMESVCHSLGPEVAKSIKQKVLTM